MKQQASLHCRYIQRHTVPPPKKVKATKQSCCVCVCADGTFMTSHKTKTSASAPGEVIWLDMATSHTHSQTHTAGINPQLCPLDQIHIQKTQEEKEEKKNKENCPQFLSLFQLFFFHFFSHSINHGLLPVTMTILNK